MLKPDLLAILQTHYEMSDISQVSQLAGGEWKSIFRLDSAQGACVVSISHPSALIEEIVYEHAFLRYLNPRLPQIPAPMRARNGSTYFQHEGRIVSLFP